MSQNSAHSSGAGSSGYQSNPSISKTAKNSQNNSSEQKRPSLVSTVSRDTKPRLLPTVSSTMTNKQHLNSQNSSVKPAMSTGTAPSRAQSIVDKSSNISGSVYAEISTPSSRAPNAQALINNYSSTQNLPGNTGTMMSGTSEVTTVAKSNSNAPKRTFSQPQITSLQNRASYAPSSRGYSTLKPYQRNCAPN